MNLTGLTRIAKRTLALPVAVLFAAGICPGGEGDWTDAMIVESFRRTHSGFSSDEMLIQDSLRDAFLDNLQARSGRSFDEVLQRDALLDLLRLRKAGRLPVATSRRAPRASAVVASVGEIAARVVSDRHRVSLDTLLADPRLRAELARESELILVDVDPEALRRAVLSLRKRRALRPELVLRVADWSRRITTGSLDEVRRGLDESTLSDGPGVYLFRDATGYLYIGEAANLRRRLAEHLGGSDRAGLARYLDENSRDTVSLEIHAFAKDSPASRVAMRRAYESELIRSRQPRFNVRP